MSIHADLPDDISNRRRVAEERLRRLLQQAGFGLPDEVDTIQYLVSYYHHTRFNTFFSQITSMFASAPAAVDKDALFLVMTDAWHYFPHDSLHGKSPAEILDAGETLGRWKTKPIKRSNR
jgi:hypothetical protein